MAPLSSPVIDALNAGDRRIILDRVVRRPLEPGEPLYLAGDRKRRLHVVEVGLLKLSARTHEGDETILFLALPGDVVGDIAALDDLPQPLDAVAACPTVVVGLDSDLLIEILERNPQATLELGRQMARRLRWVCDAALERTSSEVPARLAGRLLDLADLSDGCGAARSRSSSRSRNTISEASRACAARARARRFAGSRPTACSTTGVGDSAS